ncbi:MAG: helix-turn-helix domain-containing protein [Lachnospiraceae bacterium]|nr:helix-turn-helix domain-containing protein [Lachnospiraceae bacterium]
MLNSRLIAVIGLDPDEVEIVKKNIPQKDCEIMDTEDVRDIIAVAEMAVIVKTSSIEETDIDMLLGFYSEIAPFSESVIFIGDIQIPDALSRHILTYKTFDELKENLKYVLLSAYRKQKKTENFSATLANAITILSLIRKQPYITSAELAERLELSQRSVQRYIETLRVAGEWIEYCPEKRGWMLSEGKSVLWGDFE